jgi:DNA repair protein RecN (Recombination protein N)
MLCELRVENLLLIERAELRLGPGLNVLTGETGAGKTVLAHALDLLLGGKPRSGIVRPGATEAYVEGVFDVPEGLRAELEERELLSPDAEDLVLARRVSAEGRTRAYVGGRSATAADLRDVGGALLSFYGQHEHRKLTLASAQLDILDGFCGADQARRRDEFAGAYAQERAAVARLEELHAADGARERELDLLEWELAEIERADPSEAEEAELLAERSRLRHAEALSGAVAGGLMALEGDPDGIDAAGAASALATVAQAMEALRGVDPGLDVLGERFTALALEAEDLSGELRRYADGVEAAPGRLDVVEERLAAFDRLKRKHGGTLTAVLEHAEASRLRRDALANHEEAIEEARARVAELRADLERRAADLRAAREAAAGGLAEEVRGRLAALAMDGATFEASLSRRDGFGPSGGDEVEFLIAPNPGVPAGPLRETASGGELSRVMLALMGAAADGASALTLVFDEIDAGIGGQTARAVGEQLRALAQGRQIICITHLPQIASLADRHFRIAKDTSADTALTTVTALASGDVVGELARMLGSDEEDKVARRHARELLKAA